MALSTRARGDSTVVKITFGGRVSGARRNPAQAMSYMDEDTLKVVKALASEYGASKHVKLFLNSTAQTAWDAADRAEKGSRGTTPSGPLEVFGMTTRKKVYGYAPDGLIDASMDAVEQIRAARAEQQWRKTFGQIEKNRQTMASQLEALEKKYGPQLAGLADKFEKAVERYEVLAGSGGSPSQIKQAKAEIAKIMAPATRKPGRFRGAAKAFLKELIVEPGREANPGKVARFFGMNDADVRRAVNLAKRMSLGMFSPVGILR